MNAGQNSKWKIGYNRSRNSSSLDTDGNPKEDRHYRYSKKDVFSQKKIRALYGVRASLILDKNQKKS